MMQSGEKNPNFKHGQRRTKLYAIWQNMHSRCESKSCISYRYYGAKGISVCKEWREFVPFWNWALESGYSDGLSIDRIDNNGNYEPSNCRWVTGEQQRKNTSFCRKIEYRGETYTLSDLARKVGMKRETIANRLDYGWSVEDAVNKPIEIHNGWKPKRKESEDPMKIKVADCAKLLDCSTQWVRHITDKGLIGNSWSTGTKRKTFVIVPSKLAAFMQISEEELERRISELHRPITQEEAKIINDMLERVFTETPIIQSVPTADVVPVVRCKDCEHHREEQIGFVNCLYHLTTVDDDGFCKWGERRTDARMD